MRCFIHTGQEAISVCKRCGKAMCADCSSYSQHSGICPECRRDDFIKERTSRQNDLHANLRSIVLSCIVIILSIALAIWLMVGVIGSLGAIAFVLTAAFAIRVVILFLRRKPIVDRIAFLTGEIDKLTLSLGKGSGTI